MTVTIADVDGDVGANRGFKEAPFHRALRAQAEKEEAYRPDAGATEGPSGAQMAQSPGWINPITGAEATAAVGDRGPYDCFEVMFVLNLILRF